LKTKAVALAFGKVLRETRAASGLTQEQLGFEADLQRNYISELELGLKQPSVTTLFKISRALKIKPEKFVRRIDEELAAAL
jgi:transcriptional regulator with XRE-family HTH domain